MELTPEEKLTIVTQHIRNVLLAQYNAELSLMTANASAKPDLELIKTLSDNLKEINLQNDVLQKESGMLFELIEKDSESSK